MQERTAPATKATRKRPANTATSPLTGYKTAGFQSDTPRTLTGVALQQWLTKEISSIVGLTKYLKKTYEEIQRGPVDDSQVATCCLMSDILLARYACILQEMQEDEDRRRRQQALQANGKIYQLARFRRE
ncbi:MAG TPA: hypothetical protein DDY32_06025 [Desulfobulbaceae bacterium]|nr:hypothetical protein [Desulfobulbaceae bacterium]